MPLESAAFVSQLDPTNPPGTDQKKQGDDHLRMIKQVLNNTFPPSEIPGVFARATQSMAQTGTDNATWMTPLRTKEAITAQAGAGGPPAVQEEGVVVVPIATAINFTGAGATASSGGGGLANVNIPGITVREADGSPTIAAPGILEFGTGFVVSAPVAGTALVDFPSSNVSIEVAGTQGIKKLDTFKSDNASQGGAGSVQRTAIDKAEFNYLTPICALLVLGSTGATNPSFSMKTTSVAPVLGTTPVVTRTTTGNWSVNIQTSRAFIVPIAMCTSSSDRMASVQAISVVPGGFALVVSVTNSTGQFFDVNFSLIIF